MSPKASEVAWGCGIGCAVLLVAGIIVVVGGGYVLIKKTTQGFDAAIESRARLEKRFGEPGKYVPPPDGAISVDRLEAFLEVREATAPTRKRIAAFFASLPTGEADARALESKPPMEKFGTALRIGRSAFGLARDLGAHFDARDRTLLKVGMGMGEYTYIYAIVYYAWLGHSPAEGPNSVHVDSDADGERSGRPERHSMRSRVHDDLRHILENQLAALQRSAVSASQSAFRDALRAEIDAMEEDTNRVPWQDGLPAHVASALVPFRARLQASFDPATNPFELARPQKSGNLSFTTD